MVKSRLSRNPVCRRPAGKVVDTAWRGQAGLDVSEAGGEARNWGDLATRRGLAAGDLAALTLFAYVGRASHGMGSFDLGVLVTALPFYLGERRDVS